jgi:hypothetical protein
VVPFGKVFVGSGARWVGGQGGIRAVLITVTGLLIPHFPDETDISCGGNMLLL